MFGLQKYGGLMTVVGINLVVCGVVVYYFHKKMHSLETTILKQNQAFSAFMMSEIQREVNRRPTMNNSHLHESNTNELAAPEAIAAVSKMVTLNKIEVSDDDSSSSSESDTTTTDSDDDEDGSLSEASVDEDKDDKCDIKKIKLSSFDIQSSDDNDDNNNNISFSLKEDINLANKIEEMMISSMGNNFMMLQQGSGIGGSGGGGIVFINGTSMMVNKNNDNNDHYDEEDSLRNLPMPYFEELSSSTLSELNREEESKKIVVLNDSSDSDSDDEQEGNEEESKLKIVKKSFSSSSPPRSPLLLQIESLNDSDEPVKIIKNDDFQDNTNINKNATNTKEKVNTKPKAKKTIVTMDIENDEMTTTIVTNENSTSLTKTTKLEDMKVDDLRKIALDRNVDTKDNIKKMKKAELITILSATPIALSADGNLTN